MAKTDSSRPVRTGTLTLLMTAVVMCLAVLSVLALVTARTNLQMVKRQKLYMEKQVRAQTLGQQWLAQVDANLAGKTDMLPPDCTLQMDGTITAALVVSEETVLYIAVKPQHNGQSRYKILRWQIESDWQPSEKLSLWLGN